MKSRKQEQRIELFRSYNAIADALEDGGFTDYCMIASFALAAGLEPSQAAGLAEAMGYEGQGLYSEDLKEALSDLGVDGERLISDDVSTSAIVGDSSRNAELVTDATYAAAEEAFEAIGKPRDFDPGELYTLPSGEVEQWINRCNEELRARLDVSNYGIEAIEKLLPSDFCGIASSIGHAFPIVNGVMIDWDILPSLSASDEPQPSLDEWLDSTRVIYVTALNPALLEEVRRAVPHSEREETND